MVHDHSETLKSACIGAFAGLIGTGILQLVRGASQNYAPQTMPRTRDPGSFMVRQAEQALPVRAQNAISQKSEEVVGAGLGMAYGAAFGALFSLIDRDARRPLLEGAMLGIGVWAIGYLGWLPAARLAKPVWREDPKKTGAEVARHALYGIATTTAYRALHEHV